MPTEDEQAEAEVTWAKMSLVERDAPLVAALASANGMSEAVVDNFLQRCAEI